MATSVFGSKVNRDIMELLVPRLPKAEHFSLHETQAQLEAAVAPMKAQFDEIRERYTPGTLMLIDSERNITILEPHCPLLKTILEAVHYEIYGYKQCCHFAV